MSFGPREFLRHILEESNYLVEASREITITQFQEDPTLQWAFVRSLEIIGEATKRLPDDFRAQYPQVEWRGMARMRDRLIHGYFGIDYGLVWEVVQNRIPQLQQQIRLILTEPD